VREAYGNKKSVKHNQNKRNLIVRLTAKEGQQLVLLDLVFAVFALLKPM